MGIADINAIRLVLIRKLCQMLGVQIPPFLDETYLLSQQFVDSAKKQAFVNFLVSINEDHLISNEHYAMTSLRDKSITKEPFLVYVEKGTNMLIKKAFANRKWWKITTDSDLLTQ